MRDGSLPQLPYLKPWYRLARDGDRLVLEYAHTAVVFEGRAVSTLLPSLLPLLDGSRDVGTIVDELGEAAAPAVIAALELLERHRLLTEGPPLPADVPPSEAAAAALLAATLPGQPSPGEVHRTLRAQRVLVAGGAPAAAVVSRLLRRAGVRAVEREPRMRLRPGAGLVVVAPLPAELPQLEGLNEEALHERIPWLPLLPFDGRLGVVGPLYLPGQSCCYACYRARRRANSAFPDDYAALEDAPAAHPGSPALEAVAAGLAAHLALRWLAARDRTLPGTLLAFEHERVPALSAHPVLRVPRCPACSPLAASSAPAPWFDEAEAA